MDGTTESTEPARRERSHALSFEPDIHCYASIPALIDAAIEQYSGRASFSEAGRTLTFGELGQASDAFAAFLQSDEARLRPGARIAVMLPNVLAYPVVLLGALKAGLVVVNVNPLYTARELRHQLEDSGAEALVVFAPVSGVFAGVADATAVGSVITVSPGGLSDDADAPVDAAGFSGSTLSLADVLMRFHGRCPQALALQPDDLALLQYTGGTTGVSKGAMLTHGNIVANVQQVMPLLAVKMRGDSEIWITALPLYHIFGLSVNCFTGMAFGALNVLITDPRDMPGFVTELARWPFTLITGVNTMFNGLLHTEGFAELDFSSLAISVAGGMAMQSSVAQRWQDVTGCVLSVGYGLSETSPVLTLTPLDLPAFSDSIGLPAPLTEVEVRDEQGRAVAAGERGEICARGPQVMAGYWQRDDATAEVMTDDGFFRTGDIGVVVETGFLRIVDRKKDMILVSGFNVYPNEVEEVVAAMPAVRECGCVGMHDERGCEAVAVFVVPCNQPPPPEEAVIAWCRERLTAYKVPRKVTFIDEIPKSNVGKILRRELRARHA